MKNNHPRLFGFVLFLYHFKRVPIKATVSGVGYLGGAILGAPYIIWCGVTSAHAWGICLWMRLGTDFVVDPGV